MMRLAGFALFGALIALITDFSIWQTAAVSAIAGLALSLIVEGGDR